MNVVIISDSDRRYGASRSMLLLVNQLKQQYGHQVTITVLLVGGSWRLKKLVEGYKCKAYKVAYWPYAQSYSDNLLYNVFKRIVCWGLYWFGRQIGVTLVGNIKAVKEADIIHCNSSRVDLGAIISRKLKKPLIWHIREFGEIDFSLFYYRQDYIKLMNKAQAIIAVSSAVATHWVKKGIKKNLTVSVYNGVFPIQRTEGTTNPHLIRFLVLGRIDEKKGQGDVIRACARLPKSYRDRMRIDLIGGGKKRYVEKVKASIKDCDLEDIIRLKGYCNNPSEIMKDYDVGITCSRKEAFGRVTAEYMMAGLAVIASDSGANTEIIRDGIDGLLYTEGDEESLCEKIKYMMDNYELIRRFGDSGCSRAAECFSAERHARAVYSIYEKIYCTSEALEGR